MKLTLLEDHYKDAENGYNYSYLSAVDMETAEVIASCDNYNLHIPHDLLHSAFRGVFINQLENAHHTIINKGDDK